MKNDQEAGDKLSLTEEQEIAIQNYLMLKAESVKELAEDVTIWREGLDQNKDWGGRVAKAKREGNKELEAHHQQRIEDELERLEAERAPLRDAVHFREEGGSPEAYMTEKRLSVEMISTYEQQASIPAIETEQQAQREGAQQIQDNQIEPVQEPEAGQFKNRSDRFNAAAWQNVDRNVDTRLQMDVDNRLEPDIDPLISDSNVSYQRPEGHDSLADEYEENTHDTEREGGDDIER